MTRTRLAALALTGAALGASGCGKSAKPLTRAQLIAKADVVCRRINRKLSSITIKSQQDIARVAPKLAAYEQEALTDLTKLVPPMALANDWKEIVAGAQTLADNVAKLGEYAKSNNIKAARPLIASSSKIQQRIQAIAKRDGFQDCSKTA
jgi:ABC-type dipeptide/oligopeptide/nickel transport system ATPase component